MPEPRQGEQKNKQGVALAFDRETNWIRAAKGQKSCQSGNPGSQVNLSESHRLTHHHQATSQICQPGQKTKGHRALADQMSPNPKQTAVSGGMGSSRNIAINLLKLV